MKRSELFAILMLATLTAFSSHHAAAEEQPVTPAKGVKTLPGFRVEKLFHVPKDKMGSWVALTVDGKGRLVASDQGKLGLYVIEPAKLGDAAAKTKVAKLPVDLSAAQGLLWAHDALYAHVHGKGMYRATDTNGDGLVDKSEALMPTRGGGEHGQHALLSSPDGKSIFAIAGNHTNLPDKITASRIPQNWGEDLLLPRRWDARGHAAGKLAPGGWILEVTPDGQDRTVYSIGYRNQYDGAFNADGELFAYDADMEWDLGSPWYRPTRLVHATSGSEFGWRSGTGKWPTYYEDSLPPAVDIGPGSPVGVTFGYGAKFPAKYQKACFLLDWTYSTIHAVHLTPQGSSYVGTKEDFVSGSPLPVTDGVIGADGAFYFTVGGRGGQSALYRVVYEGDAATAAVDARNSAGAEARALRRRLEAMHAGGPADLDLIFANLGNEDRFIRYAARIALEHQPIDAWRAKSLQLDTPMASINGAIALARQGKADDLPAVLSALGKFDFAKLGPTEQLAQLRAYQLAFIRLGKPDEKTATALAKQFDAHFPSASDEANAELVQLLVYLDSPTVVGKTLALIDSLGPETVPDWGELIKRNARYGGTIAKMLKNMSPLRKIHLMFVLRNAQAGWTPELRERYFNLFVSTANRPGGNSFIGFLEQMRGDALKNAPEDARQALGELGTVSLKGKTFVPAPLAGEGREWSKAEAIAALQDLGKRDLNRGRNVFHAAQCANCHRFNGEGGALGPDLSTAMQKYSIADMLDSVLEPSKVISDQYGSHQVITLDGRVLTGRAVEIGDLLYIYTVEASGKPVVIKKSDVDEKIASKVSQMPADLINSLNAEELKDLIAYLKSAGGK